ncbi:MAG: substrate-binding domain-containing protein [Candidatus Marinimicrobia bacterium]|nr:substrate-binding domain-containing protein [Candidatus Neomarinimicrobiota bacterium]
MASKKRITIKEIAKKANVSIGTVDRVIHNRGKVSEEKEKLIRKIMKEENYKPNIFARNLKLSKTFVFGALLPKLSQDSYYWELPEKGIKKAAEELANRNVKIKFYHFDKSSIEDFRRVCNEVQCSELDGILMAPVLFKETKNFLDSIDNDIPYVFFDSTLPEANNLTYIGQNSYDSGFTAGRLMRLLLRDKESDIAIIKILPEDYHIEERTNGFISYLQPFGNFNFNVYGVNEGEIVGKYAKVMEQVLKENDNLNGIFVPNANTHYIAEYIKNNTNKKDIRIIGYDLLPENKKYLKARVIDFIIDQSPKEQGLQGVMSLYKYLVLKEDPPKEIIMPINIATKENMEYY